MMIILTPAAVVRLSLMRLGVIVAMSVNLFLFCDGVLAQQTPSAKSQQTPPAKTQTKKPTHIKTNTHRSKGSAVRPPPASSSTHRRASMVNAAAAAGYDLEDFDARWGCVASSSGADLMRLLGLHDEEMSRQLAVAIPDLPLSATPCLPYAVLVDSRDQVLALALAWYKHGDNNTHLETFSRVQSRGTIDYQTQLLSKLDGSLHVETIALADAINRTEAVTRVIPAELRFELAGVAAGIANSEEGVAHPRAQIQVIFDEGEGDQPAHLQAVSLIDEVTGQDLGQALWLERDNLPGGFFTPGGESLERQFWTNPVSFTHISRGVGADTLRITLRTKVTKRVHKKLKVTEVRRTVVRHENHIGVDFAAPKDTPVLAVADGKVVFAANYAGYGNLIILEHPGGYTTHYGHLNAFDESTIVGSLVHRGQVIGYVGSTGLSTGYHLHYEIRLNGAYLDPLDESTPLALWSLRRADYGPLVKRILLSATSLSGVQSRHSLHFPGSAADR
jgi:murein DD-endopeptidase MepM/ murein hydrolase activator NlpD